MRALLDAALKDPDQEDLYMGEVRKESEAFKALRALVLPCPVPLSAVKKLEESLGKFGEAGQVRGLKRLGEGAGEGSEERRKRARNVLNHG